MSVYQKSEDKLNICPGHYICFNQIRYETVSFQKFSLHFIRSSTEITTGHWLLVTTHGYPSCSSFPLVSKIQRAKFEIKIELATPRLIIWPYLSLLKGCRTLPTAAHNQYQTLYFEMMIFASFRSVRRQKALTPQKLVFFK